MVFHKLVDVNLHGVLSHFTNYFSFPQSVTDFAVARKGHPKMIGAWLSSLVVFISTTRKSTGK